MARRPRKRLAKRLKKRRPFPRQERRPPPQFAKRHHNLPAQFTSFIGRESEIVEIKRLLGATRLLTLIGVGGCGKTRLALQTAGELLDQFPDGVWFVDLAALSNSTLVPKAVATALGVPEQPRRNVADVLIDSLRSSKALLIVDNCEYLLPPCADVIGTLLRECSELRILATSREPLNLKGETQWTVPCLALPDRRSPATTDGAMKYDAVRLFVDRAAAAHSAFAITDRNAPAIAQLCLQLDGIPLAIEMAAVWVRVLTTEEIVTRLSDRFRFLASRGRVVTPRHQTLKMAMDWSYESLREPERLLLARLSVFAGGWTLDAAEATCSGNGVDRASVFTLLTSLVDKSLVVAETNAGRARYRLLETVRQYGLDRLTESGQANEMRRRHRDWCLSLAEVAEPKLRTPEQLTWLQRLDMEHDNLRWALEWSKAENSDKWLRLTAALHQFWFIRSYFTEGREWLEGALGSVSDAPPSVRAVALCGAGILAWRQGDTKGKPLFEQSLALFRQSQDRWGTAYALHHLAHVTEEGELGGAVEGADAASMFEQSVALFQELGDRWGVGWSLLCLGDLALLRGDEIRALALLEESLPLCRETGNMHSLAYVLEHLGIIAGRQGDYARANALLEEAVSIAQQVGDKYHLPFLRYELGNIALAQGGYDRALTLYGEALILQREVGDNPRLGVSFKGLARLACGLGDYGKAARLVGVVDALRAKYGFERLSFDRVDDEQCVAVTLSALGEKSFERLRAEGRRMSLEDAMAYAVEPSKVLKRDGESAEHRTQRRTGLLAPREREVAALITEGKTNREIAAQLSISEGTVEAHVQHILNKLSMNTRAQIAAWIVAHRREAASPPD
jgi:predicted ATPase/DNA-binding CsgD family transcriptional regulator